MDQPLSRPAARLFALLTLVVVALITFSQEAEAQFKGKNGRIFYISVDPSGDQRVFSSKVSGGGRKIVSPPGLDPSSVAVSPNGRVRAISGGRPQDTVEWIFLGRSGGGKFRRLVKGRAPGFSPNGRRLVYIKTTDLALSERFEIRTIRTNGRSRRTLIAPVDRWLFDTQYTPNGKRIVFTATVDPNVGDYDFEVYSIRSSDGRRERQITDDGGFDIDFRNPDVSPSGKRVAVAAYDGVLSRRSICTVPIGGGPIDVVATPDSAQFDFDAPMYSPDGRRMVFERIDSAFDEYYLIFQNRLIGELPNQSLAEPALVVPTPPASPFGAFGPVWSPRPR
ncbi:MAG: TolB family protein [bacterium]